MLQLVSYSIIVSINNMYLIEIYRNVETQDVKHHHGLQYLVENSLWQAASVLYWAVKDKRINTFCHHLDCDNTTCIIWNLQSSQLKKITTGSIIQHWTGQRVCICLQSTPLCVFRSVRASAAVGERMVAHVLHKWFRRQQEALEKENKFITLPYLHITPQRPVNEDSGEMSGPHPLLKNLLEEAPGWTCHLQFLPPDPWPQTLWGHCFISNSLYHFAAHQAQVSCFLTNSISRFMCVYLCRMQGWCDGKWLQTSPL